MLHLTHALKFESLIDSALARYLIRRALLAPATIGHSLFWSLKSEMSMQEGLAVRNRFGIIISQYLKCCGKAHRVSLGHSLWLMEKLRTIAKSPIFISKKKTKDKNELLQHELRLLNGLIPTTGVRLPLNTKHNKNENNATSTTSPGRKKKKTMNLEEELLLSSSVSNDNSIMVTSIIIEKCKIMSSKKAPLWLVFNTIDSQNTIGTTTVLFKEGDDCRMSGYHI